MAMAVPGINDCLRHSSELLLSSCLVILACAAWFLALPGWALVTISVRILPFAALIWLCGKHTVSCELDAAEVQHMEPLSECVPTD